MLYTYTVCIQMIHPEHNLLKIQNHDLTIKYSEIHPISFGDF